MALHSGGKRAVSADQHRQNTVICGRDPGPNYATCIRSVKYGQIMRIDSNYMLTAAHAAVGVWGERQRLRLGGVKGIVPNGMTLESVCFFYPGL